MGITKSIYKHTLTNTHLQQELTMSSGTQLTDDQVETIILQARKGEENAQFFYRELKRRDALRPQLLRVEKKLEGLPNA